MTLNLLAVLVAAIAGMGVGFMWYGPLFGKMWTTLSGFTPEQMKEAQAKGMKKTYWLAFVTMLIMSYFLAIIISDFTSGVGEALRAGLLMWLALIIPTAANTVLWEGKPKKLFYLHISERLVTIWVMVAILAAF